MRFIFDTNIIISATLIPDSVPAQALKRGEDRGEVLYSDATLHELLTVLECPKLRPYVSPEDIQVFFAHVQRVWRHVYILQDVQQCRDPKDDMFLALAINGDADTLVTGDKDLLVLAQYQNIRILTARAFLDEIV